VLLAAVLLVLAAAGLFAAGLAQDSAVLLWSSFGGSVTAAGVLAISAVTHRARSRRAEARPAGPSVAGARGAVTSPTGADPETSAHRGVAATDTGPIAVAPERAAGTGPVEPATGAHAVGQPASPVAAGGEPPIEEVAVADLLLVLDLTTDVLVVDEHPRYHLTGCRHLAGTVPVPVPMDEARTGGFTPCGTCTPDRVLAQRERARRTARPPAH
jgi:hypothetical protein